MHMLVDKHQFVVSVLVFWTWWWKIYSKLHTGLQRQTICCRFTSSNTDQHLEWITCATLIIVVIAVFDDCIPSCPQMKIITVANVMQMKRVPHHCVSHKLCLLLRIPRSLGWRYKTQQCHWSAGQLIKKNFTKVSSSVSYKPRGATQEANSDNLEPREQGDGVQKLQDPARDKWRPGTPCTRRQGWRQSGFYLRSGWLCSRCDIGFVSSLSIIEFETEVWCGERLRCLL
jgi:hypothetical protein